MPQSRHHGKQYSKYDSKITKHHIDQPTNQQQRTGWFSVVVDALGIRAQGLFVSDVDVCTTVTN
jgi:hypothetical protein